MVKSTAFFVALPHLTTTLVAGCSEATWSDEPSQFYAGTVTISKQLDAGFTDLAWETIERFEVSFGNGSQSFPRVALERNGNQISGATSSASDNEFSIKGYDRLGNLVVSNVQALDVESANSFSIVLSPVYSGTYKGSASLFVSWKGLATAPVTKVELVNDDDDSVIVTKDLASEADATYLSIDGTEVTGGSPVHVKLYGSDGSQVGYTASQTIKVAANLTSTYTCPIANAGTEPAYVPAPASGLVLAEASATSLTYRFTMPETYDALEVVFDGASSSYAFGDVPSELAFDGLEADSEHTITLTVLHTHKRASVRSEEVSLTSRTLLLPLELSINEGYAPLQDGLVQFTASTNREAALTWSSSDNQVLSVVDATQGIFRVVDGGTVTITAQEGDVKDFRDFEFAKPPKSDASVAIKGAEAGKLSITLEPNGPYTLAGSLHFTISNLDDAYGASWYLNSTGNLVGTGNTVTITPSTPGIVQNREGQAQHLILVLDDGSHSYSAGITINLP